MLLNDNNDHCSNEMKWVELEIDSHGRKAAATTSIVLHFKL